MPNVQESELVKQRRENLSNNAYSREIPTK